MNATPLRTYGAGATIQFEVQAAGTPDLLGSDPTFAAGDCKISKDGGAFSNTTNTPTWIGVGLAQVVLTATEMQAARIRLNLVDQAAPKVWYDVTASVETYGDASAQHPVFPVNVTQFGGQTTSATGAVNGDSIAAILADTNELQTDWADGGRLDLILDARAATADLTNAVADSVPADGSRPSVQQGIYMMVQMLTEMAIAGTTLTVRKPDGSTTLMQFTLNNATNPTSITRSG